MLNDLRANFEVSFLRGQFMSGVIDTDALREELRLLMSKPAFKSWASRFHDNYPLKGRRARRWSLATAAEYHLVSSTAY